MMMILTRNRGSRPFEVARVLVTMDDRDFFRKGMSAP